MVKSCWLAQGIGMKRRNSDANSYIARYKLGYWDTDLAQIALEKADDILNPHEAINHLDICHSIHGVTPQRWLDVAERSHHMSYQSPKLYLRLASLLVADAVMTSSSQSNRSECLKALEKLTRFSAVGLVKDVVSSGFLGSLLQHYPKLLTDEGQSVLETLPTRLIHAKARHKALTLATNTKPFKDIIDGLRPHSSDEKHVDSPYQIAVVGNSPTIMAEHRGPEIDAADIVIRFNHCPISTHHHTRIGSRTDLWIMSPSISVTHCPADAKAIVVSGLNGLSRPSLYWQALAVTRHTFSEFSASIWYTLVNQFHAPPSAGALVLASLEAEGINADVRCYGFTTNHNDVSSSNNHHADKTPRSGRHNWQAEIDWLAQRLCR